METILGLILILTFCGMIWYCVKGYNLMVGFFIMSVLWVAIAFIGNAITPNPTMADKSVIDVLTNVFQTGPENYGKSILVNIFFGAFFGRVLIDTGIAATLIRKVVELGGDKPRITMTLLCIVTALIFTSMTGIGPVISIAVFGNPICSCYVCFYGLYHGRYFC
jgi:H+/gluconate symporter-like permease